MIRLIVQVNDCNVACHVDGAKAETWYRTFDIEMANLEALLRPDPRMYPGLSAVVVGAEVLTSQPQEGTETDHERE
jgi:hypothetical protein